MANLNSALLSGVLLASAILAAPEPATAQPVPNTGQVAAGVDVGLFLPTDSQLDSSFTGGGFFEFYLTPRLGLRTGVMSMRPGYQGRNDEQERQIRLGADLIYNWEYGQLHPFLGGGTGVHMLRTHAGGQNVGTNHNKLGFSALGGFEYFLSRDWTVKTEGRYHWVSDIPFVDPSGFALTVGLKRYF
jgi:opacity protein-like surface antigen